MRTPRPRDEILRALKIRGDLFASEIASALGMGTSAVRPHRDSLAADELVAVEVVRGGLGRPRYRYRLTTQGHESFQRSYDELATSFVASVRSLGGEEMLDRIFRRHEQDLVQRYGGRMDGLDFDARMQELARILDECGYMVRLERIEDGYRLTEHNCPVSRVASECGTACESELRFIRSLAAADVDQVAVSPEGAAHCEYLIRERQVSSAS